MRQLTISDVRRRLNNLKTSSTIDSSIVEGARLNAGGSVSDIKRTIEKCVKSNSDVPFSTYLNLYESLIDHCDSTVSEVEKMGSYLNEEAATKVRTSKEVQSLIKRRLTRMKNKSPNAIFKAMQKSKMAKPGEYISKKQSAKTETAISMYESFLETLEINDECDRILENYNRVSKRFNLEILFNENTRVNGVYDTVVELCSRIDTYNMPTQVKFNTVIETAWYGFESNCIPYTKKEILEAALDYFAFKPNGLDDCKKILDVTVFYDKDDKKDIDILMEDEPEKGTPSTNTVEENVRSYCVTSPIRESEEKDKDGTNDFDRMFTEFKKKMTDDDKNAPSKLRSLVTKLYTKNVTGIITETPKFLKYIRSFFIISTAAVPIIGPVIMIIGLVADKFIALHMERQEVEKMIKCFESEIKASNDKLKTLTDTEDKDRMKKYIKALNDAKDKIEEYYHTLLTDDEVSARYDSMFNNSSEDSESSDFNLGDDDFNFDDDDFDFGEFMEASALNSMYDTANTFIESYINTQDSVITDRNMYELAYHLDDEIMNCVAEIVATYPDVFFKESFVDGIRDCVKDMRSGKIKMESTLARSIKLNSMSSALHKLSHGKEFGDIKTIYEANIYLESVTEAYGAITVLINSMSDKPNPLMEASFTNTLKMASMKLKNAFKKMTDKEKNISRSIDVGLNSLTKGVERALTTDNREAVIKGSILPSASKLIKMGIVNAGLVVIGQPILAVILTLGYIGTSAKFKAKERQMLVDEIEIELKMCQKYIDIAESKNDMKALKQLLQIQRDLERQHQRIKYKMKVELGQKYYDAKHVGDE